MKKGAISALVLWLFACQWPTVVTANDYAGQWLGTIVDSINMCEGLGKAEPGDYKLTIIQEGGDIIIMDNVQQHPYTGVISPEKPLEVFVQGTYVEHGGYISELVTIHFTDETRGEGESVWRWSDGYHGCGGRFSFVLTRVRSYR